VAPVNVRFALIYSSLATYPFDLVVGSNATLKLISSIHSATAIITFAMTLLVIADNLLLLLMPIVFIGVALLPPV
jgi:hypothetical protein